MYVLGSKHKAIFPQLSPRGDKIGLLQFADDMILFFGAKETWATEINSILNTYVIESGQQIDRSKSDLMFSVHTPHVVSLSVEDILTTNESQHFKYLGSNLKLKGSLVLDQDEIMGKKIQKRLSGRKGSVLSPAGRRIMIQAVYFYDSWLLDQFPHGGDLD